MSTLNRSLCRVPRSITHEAAATSTAARHHRPRGDRRFAMGLMTVDIACDAAAVLVSRFSLRSV
jgi:hypothetical protein